MAPVGAIPEYWGVQPEVFKALRLHGGLGALVIDVSPLARVERGFGPDAYDTVRRQIEPVIAEIQSRVRDDDIIAADGREGDRFYVFLTSERPAPFKLSEMRKLADRIENFVTPRVARLTQPFLRERSSVHVGHAFVVYSPLAGEDRQIQRLIDEALVCAALRRTLQERDQRDHLLEIIYNKDVWTAFQPIVEIESRAVMGHEALSRGPRGTDLEYPTALFGVAARHELTEDLERSCRQRAFHEWAQLTESGRLFVNTVPSTVRDPSFLGRGVIEVLGPKLKPSLVTLEITERQVIENLTLYREAMHGFIEMGFSFAIDDLGAGYSGLETLVSLGASYLKIDMGLVRDVHLKRISQQVVKAIAEMGEAVGATVIAEGIETEQEAAAVVALGVNYGQGYLFGRPLDVKAMRERADAAL
jgi:EAL domain-containing protein (putative c-di-GMP-specific phosphodiesterase class I)